MDVLRSAADLLAPPEVGARRFHDRPDAFMLECLRWRGGESPAPYQLRSLRELAAEGRIVERGPRRMGKTARNCAAILWFGLTR